VTRAESIGNMDMIKAKALHAHGWGALLQ
jgi:hypothetical protein